MADDMAKIIKTGSLVLAYTWKTQHLHNIRTTLDHRQRRWADAAQMLHKCLHSPGSYIILCMV